MVLYFVDTCIPISSLRISAVKWGAQVGIKLILWMLDQMWICGWAPAAVQSGRAMKHWISVKYNYAVAT